MNLKFHRIRKWAKVPVRAHETDAGMDIFYCPKHHESAFSIPEGSSRVIPTGLKVEVPKGYMLEIKNKSGIASKRQLLVGACVIDPGYDGEIFINLHNTGFKVQLIEPGEKIAQAVLIPVVHCGIEEVKEDTLNKDTDRGDGGFGSTGRW
tara:strand:- start:220 stop:669 length:450 start_codon:yes stop_codon:yes gene_type:complete